MRYRFLIRAVKARALKKWSCRTILSISWSCRGVVFRGAPEDLPGTKDPVAACLLSMWLTVARVKHPGAAIAPCLMPSWARANTSCLIPIGVGWGIVWTIRKTFEKYANIDSKLSQCEDWFGGMTTYTVVSELDDRTWPCIECLPKVVSDFVGEKSRVYIMPISAKWKYKSSIHIGLFCLQWGCSYLFLPRVYIMDISIWNSKCNSK